ncbi:hypothetical protein ACG2LH_01375 [Zhouia sp. PK063]|uniref:hypothetical protein n=1 Tax=Zhouia sp. PK063 TaxID=3373602 RepID=UPI0037B54E77
MKKLVLMAAIALGSFTTFANTMQINTNNDAIEVKHQEEFTEISVDKVPEAVTAALEADFPGAKIDKAYVNDSEQYKLAVKIDDKATTLYANKDGEWIEM